MGDSPFGESNEKKLAYINRYTLAKVLFSDSLREVVVNSRNFVGKMSLTIA
jgi:hypothetical protein